MVDERIQRFNDISLFSLRLDPSKHKTRLFENKTNQPANHTQTNKRVDRCDYEINAKLPSNLKNKFNLCH